LKPAVFGPVPYNSNFKFGDGVFQKGRRPEQDIQSLARVKPAYRQNDEFVADGGGRIRFE
jgi:hypothetical protein